MSARPGKKTQSIKKGIDADEVSVLFMQLPGTLSEALWSP